MWYIPEEYEYSPTVYLESLFTSIIIDAHDGRDMEIFYVHGA